MIDWSDPYGRLVDSRPPRSVAEIQFDIHEVIKRNEGKGPVVKGPDARLAHHLIEERRLAQEQADRMAVRLTH